MKKLLLIIYTLCSLQSVLAQDELKRANNYFDRAFYSDAIPLYEALLPHHKNLQLIKNLADSYHKTFHMKAAAKWYGYLVSNYGEKIEESYYFKLNQSLKALGQHEEAHKVLFDFYKQQKQPEKIAALEKEITYLENVQAIGKRFDIKNLQLNTTTSEFGAIKIDSNLIYNAVKKSGVISKLYRWNNQNYLDIYSHPIDKLIMGDSLSQPFSSAINTKMHEGTFAITKDRKTIYFTRNAKKRTDAKKIKNLKIFKAEWIDGDWKHITALPFNNDEFSNEHPALNENETKLYFSSDRNGGFGSFDLYVVDIHKDGSFGNPVNLGKQINTDKKEQFPFLDKDGNLYFSSNGHPGYGLLDVFISANENETFQTPDNLGLSLNSGYDDFSFSVDTDGIHGYFSSNRPGGKGSDDIYAFTQTKPLIIEDCHQIISGILTDKTSGTPITNGKISLLDSQGAIVKTIFTDANANFKFQVNCATHYRIEGQKEDYEDNFRVIQTDKERNTTKDGSLTLFSIKVREEQKAAELLKKQEEAEKRALAEAERKLKEEKAAKEKRIQQKKEAKKKEAIARKQAEKQRLKKIEEVIQKEEAIVKKGNHTIIETDEIHFDYSMWYLRRETRERLGKVVEVMTANPGMVIEIGSHTDIRGNSAYNKTLSQKRANAVKEFLVKKGIAQNRIVAKGYGESQPIVQCETESSCTEEDHEWNRRCEFVIVEWNTP